MVNVKEQLILYCIAEGLPTPKIQWYKNNVSIPRQPSPVHLASTRVPGTTVYTCEGRNNAGNMENIVRASITVVVKSMWIIKINVLNTYVVSYIYMYIICTLVRTSSTNHPQVKYVCTECKTY